MKKRAVSLLRVSDQKQWKKYDDDYPTQRAIIQKYIDINGWEFTQEYAEGVVSAFKTSKDDRDVLQTALRDAKYGKYDILVVYHDSRLSRISEEYIVVLSEFYRCGVRVFSATEDKELVISDHGQKLLRFIEGWKNEGDSITKSILVSSHMEQQARDGKWSGGKAPFGFRLTRIKGQPLEIDEEQKVVLETMFDLHEQGYGALKIAEELNKRGYTTSTGLPWNNGRVYYVMQNPIVTGLPAFNRTIKNKDGVQVRRPNNHDLSNPDIIIPRDDKGDPKPVPELVIIPLERWLAAMERTKLSRPYTQSPGNNKETKPGVSRHSQHLLTGFLKCGYCGSPVIAKQGSYTLANGDKCIRYYYICLNKSRAGKDSCKNKHHQQNVIDELFIDDLKVFFDQLNPQTLNEHLNSSGMKNIAEKKREIKHVFQQKEKANKLVKNWTDRLDDYMLEPEKSLYTEEELVMKVRENQIKLKEYEEILSKLQIDLQKEERHITQINRFVKTTPEWLDIFSSADAMIKKQMVAQVLDKIVLWTDKLEFNYAIDIASITETDYDEEYKLHIKTSSEL